MTIFIVRSERCWKSEVFFKSRTISQEACLGDISFQQIREIRFEMSDSRNGIGGKILPEAFQ